MADKKITRRSNEELLKAAMERVKELERKVEQDKLSAEQKEEIKLAKRPLINAVNRIKTLEEVEQWKKALEGVVDFK